MQRLDQSPIDKPAVTVESAVQMRAARGVEWQRQVVPRVGRHKPPSKSTACVTMHTAREAGKR